MYGEIPRHGGARAGSGRPPKDEEDTSTSRKHDEAKAREMEAKAGLRELELEVKRGTLVERGAVQAAAATAQQLFAQTVRSLPDVLERSYGIKPDVVETISRALDEALGALSTDMEAMCRIGLE